MHDFLVPKKRNSTRGRLNRDKTPWITEYDVLKALKDLGHRAFPFGLSDDLNKLDEAIHEINPNLIFNMVETFRGDRLYEPHLASFLELKGIPYTGCNPRGLTLARDKGLAKKILHYHQLPTPKFFICLRGKTPHKKDLNELKFPLIVKCLSEESSYGLSQSSIVKNNKQLSERLDYIHKKLQTDAIVEEFIIGRELSVGVLGNDRPEVLPVCEVTFNKSNEPLNEIYTPNAKWNPKYQKKKGIKSKKAKLQHLEEKYIQKIALKSFKELKLNGYARLDIRLGEDGTPYIIEINPNPGITADCEFAKAAKWGGIDYPNLIEKILYLGLHFQPQCHLGAA
tara:strand:- start:849 stop:1865 length:1017 start_codon:yes stop_codon:yes gene_type:complete